MSLFLLYSLKSSLLFDHLVDVAVLLDCLHLPVDLSSLRLLFGLRLSHDLGVGIRHLDAGELKLGGLLLDVLR